MKRFMSMMVAVLAVLGLAETASAQVKVRERITLIANYDLDSAVNVFPISTGEGGEPWQFGRKEDGRITTVGSSTTVIAFNTADAPFNNLVVGDLIEVGLNGKWEERQITAKASADSVTVNRAIDLDDDPRGYSFRWRKVASATSGGYFSVDKFSSLQFVFAMTQENTTDGVVFSVKCRASGAAVEAEANLLETTLLSADTLVLNLTQGGVAPTADIAITHMDQCRVALRLVSTDDGGDTGVDQEQITIIVYGTVGL